MLGITLGARTNDGAEDRVGTTTTTNKASFIASDAGVEGDIERWPKEMDERFWHAMVRISVEGV